MSLDVQILYASPKFFPSFIETLDQVAREKVYLELVAAPSPDQVTAFQSNLINNNWPSFFAVLNQQVVGWADICPESSPRMGHRGKLGMGVRKEHRGKGIGKKLLAVALNHAKSVGLEKVELHVYNHNTTAKSLYESFGFTQVGYIKNFRKIDGEYQDAHLMEIFL